MPEAKVVVSFKVYGLAITREVRELEAEAWSRWRDGTGLALVIPSRTEVWGVVGDVETVEIVKPVLLVVVDTGLEDEACVGIESTIEIGPADPRLMFWERPWADGEVV